MSARTKARKRAVDILFEADQRQRPPLDVLAERQSRGESGANPYTVEVVEGVVEHQGVIDAWLAEHSVDWSLERMPAVDRAVLRIGVYEVLWSAEVPDAVAIDEAVELAKNLSTDESPAFVNGLLGALAANKPAPNYADRQASVTQGTEDSVESD